MPDKQDEKLLQDMADIIAGVGTHIGKAEQILAKAKPIMALNTVRVINEYADGKISFERMAELMGVNFYELHSIFKEITQPIKGDK